MHTGLRVGVLLPGHILRRIVRRQPTYESAILYAKAAAELNLEAVLFSLSGYRPRLKRVSGYVWRGGKWRPWRGPLPQAVHNRHLPKTLWSIRRMETLAKQLGPGLFNPVVSRDKWDIWQHLAASETIKEYLPPTWELTPKLIRRMGIVLNNHPNVVIKPRRGSLGLGIWFVEPMNRSKRYRLTRTTGRSSVTNVQGVRRLARRLSARRPYLIQATIPLLRYRSGRCDLRVPVQRDDQGKWRVMPGTIKQATRHRFLTNIARGGRAYAADVVLAEILGVERSREVQNHIHRLSLAVAERLTERYPYLADIGIDVGIDQLGKPWIIEVNFRDQRLPSKVAGQLQLHQQLYRNPIAYGHYLIKQRRGLNS